MTQEKIITLVDTIATKALGEKLGAALGPGSVILLTGDLGAGKTTLVQGIGAGLGIRELIASPTFTLVNEYHEGRIPLYHLDLYRLETGEIENLYLENYWEGKEVTPGITAIEWSSRLPYLPIDYITIDLQPDPSAGRVAIIKTTETVSLPPL
ncbi:MAG: tRNA (adenosine(37)-N6)-threonylcarbamoyltransferase complex ATPase subunit type 1 TsaE [Chlorogloea purpurea SAG 13.99]|nr:tRNA (adenosine(37)-N6)-threonylcarbamoyltransferase complex ATPase subunit type 1 TsaE [Chlorogloea purpurea SAG 13.99]